jgi:two-component system, NarL family, invasion response regulator UvrY
VAGLIRVVIADDEADIRALLRFVLEADGRFAVVGEAEDGAATLRVLAAQQPDIVVLDLMMPEVSGIEVLPDIRRRWPAARVVIYSAAPDTVGTLDVAAVLDKGQPLRSLPELLVGVTAA